MYLFYRKVYLSQPKNITTNQRRIELDWTQKCLEKDIKRHVKIGILNEIKKRDKNTRKQAVHKAAWFTKLLFNPFNTDRAGS